MASTMEDTTAAAADNAPLKMYESFDDMGLSEELIRGIYSYGFEQPSKIQQLAIVPMSTCTDILAQAQSGTGKTGTFTIGSLSVVEPELRAPQVLVLCPTRELAQQTERVARAIGDYMKLSVLSATGGNPIRHDLNALKNGAQFVVGTPGRIQDLIHRGDLSLNHLKYVILDEADQMLDELFMSQMEEILKRVRQHAYLALFSATMPNNVLEIAEEWLRDPVRILLPQDEVTLDGIKQYYVALNSEESKYPDDSKFPILLDIYTLMKVNQALIYVNKRQNAEWLARKMAEHGFTLEYIHGDMEVAERKKRMDDFRSGSVRVLISTDLLARGIDVQQVSLVINYEMPLQKENYVHRIGRSGRYGRKGVAINLVSEQEFRCIDEIEQHYSTRIMELPDDLSVLSV